MIDTLNDVVRVSKGDIKPAAATLARAFQDYPVNVYFIPDAGKRLKHLPGMFRNAVRSSLGSGEILATSPAMEGVAIWFLSGPGTQLPPGPSLVERLTSLFTDRKEAKRRRDFMNYMNDVKQRVMPSRHWYLGLLGVDPAFRGKGFSSRLLRPMLARADRERLPCYVDTQLKANLALYEHFGFRVVEGGIIPGSNVTSWAMVREARK
jgi:ribosomal protein S18 acetylase RimI-like enzyme